mgnify:CR=1 FL=1
MYLKFGKGNNKLAKDIYTFSLPAGYSCPFAKDCLSKANLKSGKITDGKNIKFRCYSTSTESLYTNVRNSRWYNFKLVRNKTKNKLVKLILMSLPLKAKIIRIGVSGDFFSQDYFDSWLTVSRQRKNILFYAYTKAIPFWIKRLKYIPENFVLTASKGGTHDHLIDKYSLNFAQVVFSEKEAEDLGLELDFDDSHAINGKSFGLLVHGTQPKLVNQRIKLGLINV